MACCPRIAEKASDLFVYPPLLSLGFWESSNQTAMNGLNHIFMPIVLVVETIFVQLNSDIKFFAGHN